MRETICYFTRMYTLLTTSEREKERDCRSASPYRFAQQICRTTKRAPYTNFLLLSLTFEYSSLLERISAPAAASDEAMGITKPLEPTHTYTYSARIPVQ
uniref:Uncharacterized protein n=1 Tax=Trichogramma kaykai TaxID=54128 RepID=A0ABD2XCE2_9HYME